MRIDEGLTTAGLRDKSDITVRAALSREQEPTDARVVLAEPTRGRARVKDNLIVQEWTVDWFLYGDPPEGLPRCLASELIAVPDRCGAREGQLAALYELTLREVPSGFMLSWMKHKRPPQRRSAEQRAAQRLGNLKRRLAAKTPLFADEFLARELSQRPEYFEGLKDTAFRDQEDAKSQALFERLVSGRLGLTIYHRWWAADDGRGGADTHE